MVRLNGRIALRTNSSDNENGRSGGIFPKKIDFFGLLGATMAALKLKEHWDDYRKVPSEPTNNPLAPPAYRDVDSDTESATGLDTSINMPTRARRKRTCCVCCGLNCGLFCKALGIVILIFTLWNGFKLAKWLLTPSPTGLENMPEYSTSLGCLDVEHYYKGNKDGTYYTVALNSDAEHELIVEGGAVGTIVLAPSSSVDDDSIKIRTSLRSSDSRLLSNVRVHTPDIFPLPPSRAQRLRKSYFMLSTPTQSEGTDACIRYDLTVYIPTNLRSLVVNARSVAQVKVDFDDAPRKLDKLFVTLDSGAAANLVLPSSGLVSENVDIRMRGGYLVGSLPIANTTEIYTDTGDAITRLSVFTSEYEQREADERAQKNSAVAYLATSSGTGRTDFTYENRAGRPIWSQHLSIPRKSELYLTYKDAGFNGKIDFAATSYSMRNVQSDGLGFSPGVPRKFWVGDEEGGDYLNVGSKGWVGLYF